MWIGTVRAFTLLAGLDQLVLFGLLLAGLDQAIKISSTESL